jgi:RNA polymerase-binding protein DksA
MDKKKLAAIRKALEERRAEISENVDFMAGEIRSIGVEQGDESGSLGNHIAEDGSSMTEAERLSAISEDMRALMNQIDAALVRMDNGDFGICERCGKPIGAERLEAFPYVANCIECQSTIEREQALRSGY